MGARRGGGARKGPHGDKKGPLPRIKTLHKKKK